MIRVNLLIDQTVGARKVFPAPTVSRMGLAYIAIFLLAAGAMGAWRYYIRLQIAAAVEKRANLHIKEANLQKLQKEIENYQEMKQLYQNRIDLIERLKKNQAGPVLLLNAIGQSIPQNKNLWLIDLEQTPDTIGIVGFAQETGAIPDLMSNLLASGIFDAVELQEIEIQKEASKFSLLCKRIRETQLE